MKSDSLCAASDLTMPAASTALPMTTNTVGSSTPKAANSHQVGRYCRQFAVSGCKNSTVRPTAAM